MERVWKSYSGGQGRQSVCTMHSCIYKYIYVYIYIYMYICIHIFTYTLTHYALVFYEYSQRFDHVLLP